MNDTPTHQNESEKRRSNQWIFYVALIFAVGLAAYFFYRNYQQTTERKQLIAQAHIDSARIADLDAKYSETYASLLSYKGLNAQLDSIIALREKELSKCRSKFMVMVRKNKITLEQYKKQLAELQNLDAGFQTEIAQLEANNNVLIIQKDSLGKLIFSMSNTIAALRDSNAFLLKKVTLGSLLKPTSITIMGIRTKNNGKDAETSKASKTDQLKICFNFPDNDVAEADTQTFYIRIISPDGTTLSGQNSSKNLNKAETDEQIPYSMSSTIHYKNVAVNSCVYWRHATTYSKGKYTLEIYQDDYLVGTQKFELK